MPSISPRQRSPKSPKSPASPEVVKIANPTFSADHSNPTFEDAQDESSAQQSANPSVMVARNLSFEGESAQETKVALKAELEHELTDDEISDLTYSFQACDIDGGGTIEPEELHAMMAGLGVETDLRTVQLVMREATGKFKMWLAEQQARERGAALELPDEFQHTTDEAGHHGSTKHGGKRHHTELTINKKHVLVRVGQHPLMAPVRVPVTYSAKILYISGKVVAKPVTAPLKKLKDARNPSEEMTQEEKEAASLSDQHMVFAEFMYMMAHPEVRKKLVQGDWHQHAERMRKYRSAFDMADVDGSLEVGFDELEMVLLSLDSSHSRTHEDMLYLWGVLNRMDHTPTDEEAAQMKGIEFSGFLHGVAKVQKDPKCAAWMDFNKPNKFEMMSLIIDTPVSKAEEQRILEGLDGIDKVGINMIKRQQIAMEKEHMREVLTRAGEGRLRALSPEQLVRMHTCKTRAILWSGLIGFIWCLIPAYMENFLCEEYGVDGFKDAYWVCHQQSQRVTNGTVTALDDWYEPLTPMNPDEMLCTTTHVNMTSCLGSYYEDNIQLVEKEKYGSGDAFVDKDFYPLGLDTADTHRAGYRSVLFDPIVLQVPGNDYISIQEICSNCECWVCACVNHDEGEITVGHENVLLEWWVILGVTIGVNIVFEILCLMYTSVFYATRVAWALDIRLHPLNADRAFVADSLVRAAFELGNPQSAVMGVDPQSDEGGHLMKVLSLFMYKGKCLFTGLALKFVVGKATEPEFGLWWKPWLGMVTATVLWDALIAHCILLQAQIRGFGIFTSCEVFNEIMDLHYTQGESEVSALGKVQIARACGVAIVKKGSMYPTLEMLLRHAIQYLNLRGKSVVSKPGVLDDEEGFLKDLQDCSSQTHQQACAANNLTKDDQVVVLSVLLLALMLDGNPLGRAERQLWQLACETADDSIAAYYPDRLKWIAAKFREFGEISAKDLHQCFDPNAEVAELGADVRIKQFWYDLGVFLSC